MRYLFYIWCNRSHRRNADSVRHLYLGHLLRVEHAGSIVLFLCHRSMAGSDSDDAVGFAEGNFRKVGCGLIHERVFDYIKRIGIEITLNVVKREDIFHFFNSVCGVNGSAFVYPEFQDCVIDIYVSEDKLSNSDEIASVMIHEFGHVLLGMDTGLDVIDEEIEAWRLGEKYFKEINLFPNEEVFNNVKNYCLNWYEENSDDENGT